MPSESASFDDLAASYDRWYETPLGRLVDGLEKAAVFAMLGPGGGGAVLDLSCGTGKYALALAVRGFWVAGVDLSEPMLRVARAKAERTGARLLLVRADGCALPFGSGAFDLATLILGLEFVADPAAILGEVHRVLKPGASVVVAILNRTALWTLWRRLKRRFVPSIWRRARFLDRQDLLRLLEAQGFRPVHSRQAVHFLPVFRHRMQRWLEWWEASGSGGCPTTVPSWPWPRAALEEQTDGGGARRTRPRQATPTVARSGANRSGRRAVLRRRRGRDGIDPDSWRWCRRAGLRQ